MAVTALANPPLPVVTEQARLLTVPSYRPEIDGLRAAAVMLVVLCHAQFKLFRGGFVGVDVFFTISGYVVALAIFRNLERGDFRLVDFYARRLRRLAPSIYLVLAATVFFCVLYCFPQDAFSVLKTSLLVSVFYSNIYLSKQVGYFDPDADKQALLHTWSLSVEEQFYLLFPLLLLTLRKVRPRMQPWVMCALLALALMLSQHAVAAAIPQSYFKFQYRIFEFLIGTTLATFHRISVRPGSTIFHDLTLLAGLILIGYSVVNFGPQTAMPGVYALLPCVGAALVIAGARQAHYSVLLLANRPVIYIGKLSYVVYLWHWPLMFALRRLQLQSDAWMVAAIASALALGAVTHHLLEQPLRNACWSNRKTFFRLLFIPVLVMGILVLAASKTDNFSKFYPEQYRLNYEAAGHTVFETPRAKMCWGKIAVTSSDDCSVGDMNIPVNAVLWGDSHAYHLIDFMGRLGKDHQLRLHDLTMTMCPPNGNGPDRAGAPFYQSYREQCLAHNKAVMAYILSQDAIQVIVMSAVWPNYENPDNSPGSKPTTHGYKFGDTYLIDTLRQLTAAGKRIVFVDDIPGIPPELDNCSSNKLYLPAPNMIECTYDEKYAIERYRPTERILTEMKRKFPGAEIIHTYDVPCSAGRCNTEMFGVPLYRNNDTGHLGLGGSRIYYDAYKTKHPGELESIFGR
jgi:peptidoglycan/LPS O-acetylase OafA/YrhL